MLAKLRQKSRFILTPLLAVWWLWSAMAVCFAQDIASTPGGDPLVASGDVRMMHVSDAESMHHDSHNDKASGPGQSGHTGHSSDCCSELENTQCCGEPDAIKKDNLPDHDFQIVAYVTDWLTLKSTSSRPIIPTLNFYLIHSSLPRLHLLLGVFLD